MIYNLTSEEQSQINALWEKLDGKMKQRETSLAETPKNSVLEYIETINKEFNQLMEALEKERFKKLQSNEAILEDARQNIEEAIIFEYAGNTFGMQDNSSNKWNCIIITEEYTHLMANLEFMTWNYMQENYKKAKSAKEAPKIRLAKSGLLFYLKERAIPRHIKALKGSAQEKDLDRILNDCLDNSIYVVDDSQVKEDPALFQAPRAMSTRRGMILDNNYDVAMANALIQNNTNTLNATELKILYSAIAQCKKGDTEFYEYEISAKELADYFGLDIKNLYKNMDTITEHIQQAFVKIKDDENEKIRTQGWVDHCDYDKGTLTICLAAGLKPYILMLKKCYTKTKLEEYRFYKSQHSIIIRDLIAAKMGSFKPHAHTATQVAISLDELKACTNTTSYKSVTNFREKVLDVAIREINSFPAGYYVTVTPYKNGKTIEGFYFLVESKAGHTAGTDKVIKIPGKRRRKKKAPADDNQLSLKDFLDQEF